MRSRNHTMQWHNENYLPESISADSIALAVTWVPNPEIIGAGPSGFPYVTPRLGHFQKSQFI